MTRGERVLFEGAQGVLLDIDHGTYPYVTSSNTVAPNAATGTGVGSHHLNSVIGVMKAYTTRVGSGPFPTEVLDHDAETLRKAGNEFGATTGRPRRCGWLDLVALRYAVRVAGIRRLVVTKLDVLSGFAELKVCVAYELDGVWMKNYPDNVHDLHLVTPVYETMPGFGELSEVARFQRAARSGACVSELHCRRARGGDRARVGRTGAGRRPRAGRPFRVTQGRMTQSA